jgi:GMP synthase-like glutamine amidotransferase
VNKVAIIENSPGLGNYFTKFLEQIEYEIFPVWQNPQLPSKDFDAYIFTGDFNNISDGLLPIHKTEIDFFKSIQNKKIFGSCFFHQLIGIVFGGEVRKRDRRFFGWHKMIIEEKHPIFNGLKEPYYLNLNVDELNTKPASARLLATNPDCALQVIQYGDNILTCQSHPEILLQKGLESISEHRDALLNNCPDLDEIVNQTKDLANDEMNEIFMSNIIKWLIS